MKALDRLNKYRKNAAETTAAYAKHYNSDITHSWKEHRYPKNPVLATSSLRRDGNKIYADSFEDTGFNLEADAADISRNCSNWYTDDFQGETLIPVVLSFRNPHKLNDEDSGHLFFVPGTRHSDWDGVTVYPAEVFDTKIEAAYRADHYAEHEAEECREADARYQAEQQIIEQREEIHRLNQIALPLIKEIKGRQFTPAICRAVKESIEDILKERAEAFEQIETLTGAIQ